MLVASWISSATNAPSLALSEPMHFCLDVISTIVLKAIALESS